MDHEKGGLERNLPLAVNILESREKTSLGSNMVDMAEEEDYSDSSSVEEDEDYTGDEEISGKQALTSGCVVASATDGIIGASRASTRSSVKYVAGVVSKFDGLKKALVRSIGFGGILEMPQINKVSRAFTVWLLSNLDPETKTIVVNGEEVVDIVDFDVKRILGIPCGYREVTGLDADDPKVKKYFMEEVLGASPSEKNSLLAAGRIVRKIYPSPMSKEDRDHFKAAFVVFVVGHLLAPTTKSNVGSSSFWGALRNADDIPTYNWGEYVLQQLLEAASKVQSDIKTKRKVSNITGCSILIQILYLDAVKIKGMDRRPEVLPRIKVYDCSVLRLRMEADQANSSSGSKKRSWGTNVVRCKDAPEEAYKQAEMFTRGHQVPSNGCCNMDLAEFIHDNFDGKLNQAQQNAMTVYMARCATHFDSLKSSLMKENLVLVQFLLSNSDSKKKTESTPVNIPRQRAGSKRALVTPERSFRGYESADEGFVLRRRARQGVSGSRYEVRETILSGGTIPVSTADQEVNLNGARKGGAEVVLPNPDKGKSLNAATKRHAESVLPHKECGESHKKGRAVPADHFEAPSFDLGIDFEKEELTVQEKNKGGLIGDKVYPTCSVLTTEGQLNVETEKQSGMSCCTPMSARSKSGVLSWSTPDQRVGSATVSPGSYSKILAGCEVAGRMVLTEDEVNINIKPFDFDITDSPVEKQIVGKCKLAKSPWFYELNHALCDPVDASSIFEKVMTSSNDELKRVWVAHNTPRFLEITGKALESTFSFNEPMTYDIYDLVLRRLIQLDNEMYVGKNEKRWRHIMESDFAVLSLAEENPSGKRSIREQFSGSKIQHCIYRCRMIVVPVAVLMDWCCYFFDFKKKRVHVFDATYTPKDHDFYVKKHSGLVDRISAEIAKCIDVFFDNWEVEWKNWQTEYITPPFEMTCSTQSGLFSLFSICEFDGECFRNFTKESFDEFRKVLLVEVLCMENNQGRPPVNLKVDKPTTKIVYNIEE